MGYSAFNINRPKKIRVLSNNEEACEGIIEGKNMNDAKISYRATRACLAMALLATSAGGVVMASTDVAAVVDLNNRLKFVPREIRVKVGDTVKWRNIQTYPHTVTADPNRAARKANIELPDGVQPFDSGRMEAGATFRYTFTSPGTYRYVCLPHESAGMLGTVVVE